MASAIPAAWPFFRLPAWSTRARFLVGGVIGVNLILVTAGALILAATLALRPRVGRLAVPLGAALAAGVALAVPTRNLDLSAFPQLAGRLTGCAVLILGAVLPSLRCRKALWSGLAAVGAAAIAALLLAPAVRPDLVLITVDTLRADRINAPEFADLAPNIQRFARGAVRFTHAWSPATWTVPAMSSIFTGVSPTAHGGHFCSAEEAIPLSRWWFSQGRGQHPNPLFRTMSKHVETLGEALSRGGYFTAGFSTSHFVSARTGIARGFDRFVVDGDRDESVTALATDWLVAFRRSSSRPFFLFVHYFAPHQPYEPLHTFLPKRYEYGGSLPLWRFETFEEKVDGELLAQRVMREMKPLAESDLRHIATLYDGEVRWVDRSFGALLDEVDRDQPVQKALVALTSDHGEFLGEKSLIDHGHLPYEQDVRVPLLVRFPSGQRVPEAECPCPTSTQDLYPTLLRLAGVAPSHTPTAEDLTAVAVGGCSDRRHVVVDAQMSIAMRMIFGERFRHSFRVITDGRWKLLRRDDGALELYDLETDPGETTNLAEAERRNAAVLLRALEEFEAREIKYPPERPPAFSPEEVRQLRALGYLR